MKNRFITKHIAAALAVCLFATAVSPLSAEAANSSSIKDEINALKGERNEIQNQMNQIESEKNANWQSIEEKVEYKYQIDEQIFLLYSEVDNLNSQIASYSQLIAQTQTELDEAQMRLDDLNEKNKERIRAMEEEGKLSYWSVLFQANSFTDFIDRLNMIDEIQAADQRRLAELDVAAQQVADTKQVLNEEKAALESSVKEKEAAQIQLDEKRAETDVILAELNEEDQAYQELLDQYADEKAALMAEIAAAEVEYTKALAAEEAARKRAEEEARKKAEEEAKKQQEQEAANKKEEPSDEKEEPSDEKEEPSDEKEEPTDEKEDSGNNESEATPPVSSVSWRKPCSYKYISSAYGSRGGGFHNGVDFAASRGTPIYASRTGTVTTAKSMTTSYGNYVVINHGDGYSSLYAHMDYFVVSSGQYVYQGQLIGYVGSTGNSTGPHLHFTVFYNGTTVNPMTLL